MKEITVDFKKYADGLAPAIVQDANTRAVLMLGFMNAEALKKTQETSKITFWSRSKNRLWTKGETSGNFILLKDILIDCDADTILIKGIPSGPVCHKGSDTCFNEKNEKSFLDELQDLIADRKKDLPENSYTTSLFKKGVNAIAQKVGEEAVEVVIEALGNDDEKFRNESADLLFHFLILLEQKNIPLSEIEKVLKNRHQVKK